MRPSDAAPYLKNSSGLTAVIGGTHWAAPERRLRVDAALAGVRKFAGIGRGQPLDLGSTGDDQAGGWLRYAGQLQQSS